MTDFSEGFELDAPARAYLRSRADVAVPTPGDLLAPAREAALTPIRRAVPRWLVPALAAAAGFAALAFAGSLWLRTPTSSPVGAVGSACPVTVPSETFVPPQDVPGGWPVEPPALYGTRWFGTADLWTMLPVDGARNPQLARGEKTWWFSQHFLNPSGESSPQIAIVGRLLDGSDAAPIPLADSGTNASANFGLSMLVGVTVPSPGCWELTATYKGHSLSYVVLVE